VSQKTARQSVKARADIQLYVAARGRGPTSGLFSCLQFCVYGCG